jgi:hypothetical protein
MASMNREHSGRSLIPIGISAALEHDRRTRLWNGRFAHKGNLYDIELNVHLTYG